METIERINGIPVRTLGKTGVKVTVLGIGGYHIGKPSDRREGIHIIRVAIDEGINFLDNAWCYNRGRSEEIMGDALKDGYREKVFLMTKNHGRDKLTFQRQLDDSLRRLQTDHIDLLQFHEIIHEGEPERIFSEGAITYALSLPIDTLVSGIGSLRVLSQNLEIARKWKPLSQKKKNSLLHRIAPLAGGGHLERYKVG